MSGDVEEHREAIDRYFGAGRPDDDRFPIDRDREPDEPELAPDDELDDGGGNKLPGIFPGMSDDEAAA